MGQALYRTYRSKRLSEIVGQEHITTALQHALEKGTISHAYLFTGPRGVGKTSIARILAHEINGLPYEDDATHLDIIEIDAASNRRIDEIRDLRDKVHIAPTSAKYKVYIIDEVHMLTREAFNALLKTLEEPPAHAVFILATTEVHKLPETIVSRTQRYAFKPVPLEQVVAHLRHIAEQEKIAIDDEALALIAAHGEGSFRDSISLLDQVRNQNGTVSLADVQANLGMAPASVVADLIAAMRAHDAPALARQLHAAFEQGSEPAQLARQLGKALRDSLLAGKPSLDAAVLMPLLSALVRVPASNDPRAALEIAALDAAFAGTTVTAHGPSKTASAAIVKPAAQVEPHPSSFAKKIAEVPAAPAASKPAPLAAPNNPTIAQVNASAALNDDAANQTVTPAPQESREISSEEQPTGRVLDLATWQQALAVIKQHHNTLYSIASKAAVSFEPGAITLATNFAFHTKQLNQKKNKEIIAQTVESLAGEPIQIHCLHDPNAEAAAAPSTPLLPPEDGEVVHTVAATTATPPAASSSPDALAAINNIFGGAEVLPS